MKKKYPRILTPLKNINFDLIYPQAREFLDQQHNAFWSHKEVNLEKDVQYLLTELSPSEKNGILTVLKLFTLYELRAEEFWTDVVKNMFPRPEIKQMALMFGAMELSVHLIVYDKLNQLLSISNDDFYDSYKQSDTLKSRMDFMDYYLKNGTDLEKLASFCFAEGVVLFSSFAFIMSFRANGNNKLPNIGSAIKFSATDEDIHCQASSWLFRQLRTEYKELGIEFPDLYKKVYEIAEQIRLHEYEIVDMIFSGGDIEGISTEQMKVFIDSRINKVLERMGIKKLYEIKENPVAEWFDKILTTVNSPDFFVSMNSEYNRDYNKNDLNCWKKI